MQVSHRGEKVRHIWRDYNILPDVLEANQQFRNQDKLFAAAEAVLAQYPEDFGICLIHGHGILTVGEIMLAQGDVAEPVHVSEIPGFYPERWLTSGEPYEFTTRPTKMPGDALLEAFRVAMGDNTSLGLCSPMREDSDALPTPRIEWAEGRKIKTRILADGELVGNQIPTSWTLGICGARAGWYCNIYCPSKTSKSDEGHSSGT